MNVDKTKKNIFYATNRQNELLEENRKDYSLTTSKQVRLMVNFIFNNEKLSNKFKQYIDDAKKEV